MVHFRLGDSELGDEYDMRAVELLASDTLLTAQDYDFLSATVFAQNDIRNGHSESGLDRFRTAFPDASRKDVTVDFTNLKLVNEFATLLDMAGHHAEARHRWQRPKADTRRAPDSTGPQTSPRRHHRRSRAAP